MRTGGERSQLTFVLPVALREKRAAKVRTRTWRNRPDEGALLRTRLLMKSFLHHFRQSDLLQFIIIGQEDEVCLLSEILASITTDSRYVVISELQICPELLNAAEPNSGFADSWVLQQLLKLAIAHYVRSECYVTLDSDVICVRPFSYDTLVLDDRALTNLETLGDYQRTYRDVFAATEFAIKTARYRASAQLLGYRRPDSLAHRFYGETPVVLRSKSVLSLIGHIEGRFGQAWSHTLSSKKNWTEYSLYFQFLEMQGSLQTLCNLAGCNAVLDLERSVWQDSNSYRDSRPYCGRYFVSDAHDAQRGSFIAVQSWLSISSWLPPAYCDLTAFYTDVERSILGNSECA